VGGTAPEHRDVAKPTDPRLATRFPAKLPALFDQYDGPLVSPPGYDEALRVARRRPAATADNSLELDHVTNNQIDLQLLVKDYPEEAEAVQLLLRPEAFRSRFLPGQDPLAGERQDHPAPSRAQDAARARSEAAAARALRREAGRRAAAATDDEARGPGIVIIRPISRGMFRQRFSLIAFDMAEDAPDARQIYSMKVFLTPKKNGKGRFVVDCRWLNERMEDPGEMGLPKMGTVIRRVLSWKYAAQCDAVSFFSQFTVNPALRDYFRMRLGGQRGQIAEMRMKRMPMGWKYAPKIAQTVANILMQEDGIAWVDNFLVGGRTMEEFERRRAAVQRRFQRYNVEVDDTEMRPAHRLCALGLEFDLARQQYRLDPAWTEKRRTLLTAEMSQPRTYREWYQIYGAVVWASFVLERPLYMHAEALAALSQLAKDVDGQWDTRVELPEYAERDLALWREDTLAAAENWHRPQRPIDEGAIDDDWGLTHNVSDSAHAPNKLVFSDASDDRAAWVAVVEGLIVDGAQWKRNGGEGIFLGELDALLEAYDANGESDRYIIDNRGLHFVARGGHSSSYEANCRLRDRLRGRWIRSWWTPSRKNLVDPWSREKRLGRFPMRAKHGVVPDDEKGDRATQTKFPQCHFFPSWRVREWDKSTLEW